MLVNLFYYRDVIIIAKLKPGLPEQEAKSNPETLGNNRPKSTLTDVRLIYTQIRKKIYKTKATELSYIYRVKPFLKHL